MRSTTWLSTIPLLLHLCHAFPGDGGPEDYEHVFYDIWGYPAGRSRRDLGLTFLHGREQYETVDKRSKCYHIRDHDNGHPMTFRHVEALRIGVDYYGVESPDTFIWQFFIDDNCHKPHNPPWLLYSGSYEFPGGEKSTLYGAGSFKLIDQFVLNYDRGVEKITEKGLELIKSAEDWKAMNAKYEALAEALGVGTSEEVCSICYENLVRDERTKTVLTECGHGFHPACLEGWAKSKNEERGRPSSEQVRRETGRPLSISVKCPMCNNYINARRAHKVTTARRLPDAAPDEPIRQLQNEPQRQTTPLINPTALQEDRFEESKYDFPEEPIIRDPRNYETPPLSRQSVSGVHTSPESLLYAEYMARDTHMPIADLPEFRYGAGPNVIPGTRVRQGNLNQLAGNPIAIPSVVDREFVANDIAHSPDRGSDTQTISSDEPGVVNRLPAPSNMNVNPFAIGLTDIEEDVRTGDTAGRVQPRINPFGLQGFNPRPDGGP